MVHTQLIICLSKCAWATLQSQACKLPCLACVGFAAQHEADTGVGMLARSTRLSSTGKNCTSRHSLLTQGWCRGLHPSFGPHQWFPCLTLVIILAAKMLPRMNRANRQAAATAMEAQV